MAASKEKTEKAQIAKVEDEDLTLQNFAVEDDDDSDDGVLLSGRSALYSPDLALDKNGKRAPVTGWLVGTQIITSPKYKKEKTYLKVSITKPTICASQQKPFLMTEGIVLVPLAKSLADEEWDAKAVHEELCSLVTIKFLVKDKQANGNDFWHTEVRVHDVKFRNEMSSSLEGMKHLLEEAAKIRQIPEKAASASAS